LEELEVDVTVAVIDEALSREEELGMSIGPRAAYGLKCGMFPRPAGT